MVIPFDCFGHGTHVAGTIVADARNANASQPFVGVAPKATVLMYRVFGCSGGTPDDMVVEAMAHALVDGAQIISLSLGGINGWSENPLGVISNRVAQRGVFVSVAAGNEGSTGLFMASNLAVGANPLAIASVDTIAQVAWNAFSVNRTIVRHGAIFSNALAVFLN